MQVGGERKAELPHPNTNPKPKPQPHARAVQICFELATDLLDPAAAVGSLRGGGEPDASSLCGASRHQAAAPSPSPSPES